MSAVSALANVVLSDSAVRISLSASGNRPLTSSRIPYLKWVSPFCGSRSTARLSKFGVRAVLSRSWPACVEIVDQMEDVGHCDLPVAIHVGGSESELPKLKVAGSIPLARSKTSLQDALR